jgi:hypothetical protein
MFRDRHAFIEDTSQISNATLGRFDKLATEQEHPQDLLRVVDDPSAIDRKGTNNKENSLLSVSAGKEKNPKLSLFNTKQSSNQPTASSFISEDFREKGLHSEIKVPELLVTNNELKFKLGGVFRQGAPYSMMKSQNRPRLLSSIRMDTFGVSEGKTVSTPGPPGIPNPRTSTMITFSVNRGDLITRGNDADQYQQSETRHFNQTMSNKYGGETPASPIPKMRPIKRGSAVLASYTKSAATEVIGMTSNPNLMKLVLLKGWNRDSQPLTGSKFTNMAFGQTTQKDSEVIDEDDEEGFLENYPSEVEETIQMEDSKQHHNGIDAQDLGTPHSKLAPKQKPSLKLRKPPKLLSGMSVASSKFTGSSFSGLNRERLFSAEGFGKEESDSIHPTHRHERVSHGSGPLSIGPPPSFLQQDTLHLDEELVSLKDRHADLEPVNPKLDSVYEVQNHMEDDEYKPLRDYIQKFCVKVDTLLAQPSTRSPSTSIPPIGDLSRTTQLMRSSENGNNVADKENKMGVKSEQAQMLHTHDAVPCFRPNPQAAMIPQSNGFKNRFKFTNRRDLIVRGACVLLE